MLMGFGIETVKVNGKFQYIKQKLKKMLYITHSLLIFKKVILLLIEI